MCSVTSQVRRERERERKSQMGAQPVDHSTVNHPVPPRNPYASYNVLYRDICILPTNCYIITTKIQFIDNITIIYEYVPFN